MDSFTPIQPILFGDSARALREQWIYGTPEDCHTQLTELAAQGLHGPLRCVFNANGLLPAAQTLAGMTLFAQELLPALRPHHPTSQDA